MARKISNSFKLDAVASALQRPEGVSLQTWAKERGIGYSTLHRWIRQAQAGTLAAPGQTQADERRPCDWTDAQKWQAVWDCAGKNDTEIAAYCRQQGLYPYHLTTWKQALMAKAKNDDRALRDELRQLKGDNQHLRRELARMQKALAETAALITLKKKLATLWAEDAGE